MLKFEVQLPRKGRENTGKQWTVDKFISLSFPDFIPIVA